jgi:hypothetical protein
MKKTWNKAYYGINKERKVEPMRILYFGRSTPTIVSLKATPKEKYAY